MTLDACEATIEQIMEQFVEMIEPHRSDTDGLRMQAHAALRRER